MIGRTDVVGFTRIGSGAGEVLAVIQTAMLVELPSTKLRDAVVSSARRLSRRQSERKIPRVRAGRAKPRRNAAKP